MAEINQEEKLPEPQTLESTQPKKPGRPKGSKNKLKEITSEQELLNKHWQKFFNRFSEIDILKISKWKEIHILAYFYKRYEQLFGRKYCIVIKGAPTKCPELHMIRSIMATLNTCDMNIIKNYIDWVYDYNIIPQKKEIRSFGFFITHDFFNKFLNHKKEKEIIKRSTELPQNYKELAESLNIDGVINFGDLSFLKLAAEKYKNDFTNKYVQFLANLEAIGFDLQILNELK